MNKSIIGTGLIVLIAGPLLVGTCGYVIIEGWTLIDSLYMSIITLSTVGYGETQELSDAGRVFTSFLIGMSMFCIACWTAGITTIFVNGELTGAFRKQKELKLISKLKGHTIVCGGGIMARTVIDHLVRVQKNVVAIIGDDEQIELIRRLYPSVPIVEGDPKSEFSLADANVVSAGFLVAAVDSDYDNLLITITGKGLGTGIRIISCAQGSDLASRMFKVGADDVICPLVLGGEHAAKLIAA